MADLLTSGCGSFGIALLQKLMEQGAGKNILVSPASVFIALSMAWNGAAGRTQAEMSRVMGLVGRPQEIQKAERELQQALGSADPKVHLRVANALYLSKTIPFKESYLKTSREVFRGKIGPRDFARPETLNEINRWADKETEGRIPTILGSLNPESLLVILNAIYFKGDWSKPFRAMATREAPFSLGDGTQRTVHLMGRWDVMDYMEEGDIQALRLPYGSGRYAFYVFLPRKADGLNALVKRLTRPALEGWIGQLKQTKVSLFLPRWEMRDTSDLEEILPAMGMPFAFKNDADFSGMSTFPLKISQVKHKTFLKVDEKGTEAAAATAVVMTTGAAMRPEKIIEMRVDHPFLCLIRDDQTRLILFMGAVSNPVEGERNNAS